MNIRAVAHQVIKDRVFMASCFVFAIVSILAVLLLVFRIHPTELNVHTRYNAFGVVHIYSNPWYQLIPVVLFGLVILPLHIIIAIKLLLSKKNHMARLFIWLSVVVMIVAIFIGSAILGLANI